MVNRLIPIVILTRDEPRFLKIMIKAIRNRTKYPYKLFIVDNKSSTREQISFLKGLKEDDSSIEVIFNGKNEWVLGFNKAISMINKMGGFDNDYIVLSDGDLVVPMPKNHICWLEFLKNKMDGNIAAGKIGLSLDLGFIKGKKEFIKTYENEKRYMEGRGGAGLIIAPVDTTIAIYRKGLFVTDRFEMLPGHASLIKPYYYVFRTNVSVQAKHLGWRNYKNPSKNQLNEKVVSFTKYAGYIDPIVLSKVGCGTRLFYQCGRFFFKAYWSFKVCFYWLSYILKRFPRGLNEIQSKYR